MKNYLKKIGAAILSLAMLGQLGVTAMAAEGETTANFVNLVTNGDMSVTTDANSFNPTWEAKSYETDAAKGNILKWENSAESYLYKEIAVEAGKDYYGELYVKTSAYSYPQLWCNRINVIQYNDLQKNTWAKISKEFTASGSGGNFGVYVDVAGPTYTYGWKLYDITDTIDVTAPDGAIFADGDILKYDNKTVARKGTTVRFQLPGKKANVTGADVETTADGWYKMTIPSNASDNSITITAGSADCMYNLLKNGDMSSDDTSMYVYNYGVAVSGLTVNNGVLTWNAGQWDGMYQEVDWRENGKYYAEMYVKPASYSEVSMQVAGKDVAKKELNNEWGKLSAEFSYSSSESKYYGLYSGNVSANSLKIETYGWKLYDITDAVEIKVTGDVEFTSNNVLKADTKYYANDGETVRFRPADPDSAAAVKVNGETLPDPGAMCYSLTVNANGQNTIEVSSINYEINDKTLTINATDSVTGTIYVANYSDEEKNLTAVEVHKVDNMSDNTATVTLTNAVRNGTKIFF